MARKVKAVYRELPTPTSILDDILQQDTEDVPSGMMNRQRIDRRKNVKILQRFARNNANDFKKSERLVEIKVWVKVYNKSTNKEQEDEIWLPGEMVEGGKYKLMKFVKKQNTGVKTQN